MNTPLHTEHLTMRYGATTALDDCSLDLPVGKIAALVGPNGAGKTTLLQLAAGLFTPSAGRVEVFGWSPQEHPGMVLPRIGFLGQDHPLFRGFTVEETMEMGRRLNPHWDQNLALDRLARLKIPLNRRIRKLSVITPQDVINRTCPPKVASNGVTNALTPCLQHHHWAYNVFIFQPASRFWPFQIMESAIYLGMAAVLLAITVWSIRTRLV